MTRPSWRREALAMPPPAFIVGDARSGTSILYRSLQSHPDFLPSGGLNLVESHAIDELPRLMGPADVGSGPLAEFLLGTEPLERVAEDVEPLAGRRRAIRRLGGRRVGRVRLWLASGEHEVVRRYFLEAHRVRGAARLLEKTPHHLEWVPHLHVAFPSARFIFVVRHPIDVYSSYLRRYRVDPVDSSWANLTVDDFCRRWDRNTRLATSMAARSDTLLVVRYEEFTSDPEPVVRRMLDHVGAPFAEECLLREKDEAPDRWKPDPLLFDQVSTSTKRWEDFLDASTASSVQDRLAAAMRMVGYAAFSTPEAVSRA